MAITMSKSEDNKSIVDDGVTALQQLRLIRKA
jgi:hypothetical protein